jgi:hypothetical protein
MTAFWIEAGIDERYPFSHPNTEWQTDDISIQNASDSIKLPEDNVADKENSVT